MEGQTDMRVSTESGAANLLARYESLLAAEGTIRARDAADRLGASEAELVAARCGRGVTRLEARWSELIEAMPGLGRVMCLTRNDYAVHEKTGVFEGISLGEDRGLVVGPDIDLRLAMTRWRHAYAVVEESDHGPRRGLQLFDAYGTAVLKVYLRDDGAVAAFDALVAALRSYDQAPGDRMEAPPVPVADRPDADIDVDGLRRAWDGLDDVHAFIHMLRDFGVGRAQACRLAGAERAERLDATAFVAALEGASARDLSVMIFVPSPGVVQIHTGPVRRLKRVGDWFNVLDPGFNLHLRDGGIAEAWLVRKPTRHGIISSLEVFDDRGGQIAWMFGYRDRDQPERDAWRALLADLPRLGAKGAA